MSTVINEAAEPVDMSPKAQTEVRKQTVLSLYEKEIATYVRELPRLLAEGETGRYALIKGDEILSIWDTNGDAIQAGVEKFGLDPICVKKIKTIDVQRYAQFDHRKDPSCPS